jgi:protein-S-isoprenylcysteine O-methyltransferase Ste14
MTGGAQRKAVAGAAGPRWARAIKAATGWLTEDLLGGPRPWTLATILEIHKGGTVVFLGLLMIAFGNAGPPAATYLALHGGYGLVWVMKNRTFPDRRWQKPITIAGGLATLGPVLGWYWAIGFIVMARAAPAAYPLPEPLWLALAIGLCLAGIATMVAADAQKYTALADGPRLVTDGMFRFIRHPNYLGEMAIYGSFALIAWHVIPVIVLAAFWTLEFWANIVLIEASLARYPGWEAWRRRSWALLPPVV